MVSPKSWGGIKMGVAEKILFLVIPIIFLIVVVIIFFGETGSWEELKETVMGIESVLPKGRIGLEELEGDASIPADHRTQILDLSSTIKDTMLDPGNVNCFEKFSDFSNLGESGTTLEFALQGDTTVLTVSGGAGGKQIITDLRTEFLGMTPCVIAGGQIVTERFFTYFIAGQRERLNHPYYQSVSSIKIYYNTGNRNGNKIEVPDFGENAVNDESKNFESDGWLFTPDGKNICFFPTNWGNDHDEDGIANEWFTNDEENSISSQIERGDLARCS
ncbi:MAG TPA: hypothetical protein VJI32_07175 [Candidatus Nanoarchaeia archaeon]|nr:hypothetical protein [Candidatus Nanoarchaeia archaeon]